MYPSHLSFTLHSTSTHTQPIPLTRFTTLQLVPISPHLSHSITHQRIYNLASYTVYRTAICAQLNSFSTPHGRPTFKQSTSLIHEATRPLLHNPTVYIQNFSYKYLSIMEKYVSLHTLSPDGGIGRRAGLKHQWSNPSRFDPGSGYTKKN